jgi:hypothetical protein
MMETAPSTSRGRLLAFRIVGWFLGIVTIGYGLYFALAFLLTDDVIDRTHRFHALAGFAGGALVGVFSIVLVLRPTWTSAFHVLVAQAFAYLIGGLMGGDLISGVYFTGPLFVAVLALLHPDPASLFRLPGRPSVALLTYALIVTVPAWIYAVTQAEFQHGSPSDPHVEFHHWSGIAVAALGIAGAAIATSLRGRGWQVSATVTAVAAVLFGVSGLALQRYPGAPDVGWSWVAVAAGIGFWLLARIEAAREPAAA